MFYQVVVVKSLHPGRSMLSVRKGGRVVPQQDTLSNNSRDWTIVCLFSSIWWSRRDGTENMVP